MARKSDLSFPMELIQKAQDGDQQALASLVERSHSRLYALVHVRLGPALRYRVEVEDVVQETYLKAFESLQMFRWRNSDAFIHWLFQIAERVILQLARYHKTRKRTPPREARLTRNLLVSGTSPGQLQRRRERLERLEKALTSLSTEHREVIILARLQALPIKEIARRTKRSAEAASMMLLRASRQLRTAFGNTESLHLPTCNLAALFGEPLEAGGSKDRSGPRESSRSGGALPIDDPGPEEAYGGLPT